MPQETRMDRIMSGLTAMERSKLVLDSYRFNSREDPLIRRMMPARQGPAFNEAIYRMNAANMHIAGMINGLDADLQLLWSRWLVLHYLTEWRTNLREIGEAVLKGARSNGPRGVRGAQGGAQTPIGVSLTALLPLLELTPSQRRDQDGDDSLEGLQNSFGANLVSGFGRMWPDMRAVEIV